MSILKKWFEEVDVDKTFITEGSEFVINKGFKITHYFEDDSYTIQDVRHSDFYTEVSDWDLETMESHGFLAGTAVILHSRNVERVQKYLRQIEVLYANRARYKEGLSKNKPFYTKRIRNCNKNIHDYHDMMQFYQAKVEQFEIKNSKTI